MSGEDIQYLERRAEAELELARSATHRKVVQADLLQFYESITRATQR
jgi:hypothetical protein